MLLIIAGSVIPILPYRLCMAVLLGAPAASLIWLWQIPLGTTTSMALLEYTLTPLRVDGLAFTFGVIFNVAAFLSGLYMWHTHSRLEPAAALIYAGSALGAVLAGDLVTLFMFWEVTAIASALLLVIRGLRDAMIVAQRRRHGSPGDPSVPRPVLRNTTSANWTAISCSTANTTSTSIDSRAAARRRNAHGSSRPEAMTASISVFVGATTDSNN